MLERVDLFCVFNHLWSQQMLLHCLTLPLWNVPRRSLLLLVFHLGISQGACAACVLAHKNWIMGQHKANNQTEPERFNNFHSQSIIWWLPRKLGCRNSANIFRWKVPLQIFLKWENPAVILQSFQLRQGSGRAEQGGMLCAQEILSVNALTQVLLRFCANTG